MKRIITLSVLALLFAACAQNSPEAQQNKADDLKKRIAKMEKQLEEIDNKSNTTQVEKVVNVRVQKLETTSIAQKLEYAANLVPFEEVHLAPAQPGKIIRIFVEIGDNVTKGDKLVQMDDTQLKQARIQLENLEKDYKRIKTLKEEGSIAEQQYDQIKTQLEVTKTNVEFLEENTVLYAPFNGVITGKFFEDQENFSGAPNTQAGKAAIVSIQQINVLKAMINVPEQHFTSLDLNSKATISSELYPNTEFKAGIRAIYPTIDPLTRTMTVEVKVPNWSLELRPGMYSRIHLTLGEKEGIVVPKISVLQQEGTNKRYIFINDNGVAKRVNVQIGERLEGEVEIRSDKLHSGTELITAGQAVLSDGDKVNVVK